MFYHDNKIVENIQPQHRPAPPVQPGGMPLWGGDECVLTVRCAPGDYSAGVIARAVEDCDAHLLGLELLEPDIAPGDDRPMARVRLRVNHRTPVAVARSLERYGYEVEGMDTDEFGPHYDQIVEIVRRMNM